MNTSLKAHFESMSVLPEEEGDEEGDEEEWSQCSSQESGQQPRSESFLSHFTDVLMDIN
jgi:hypothetical protein